MGNLCRLLKFDEEDQTRVVSVRGWSEADRVVMLRSVLTGKIKKHIQHLVKSTARKISSVTDADADADTDTGVLCWRLLLLKIRVI